jgi:hypothetical protein
MTIYLKVRWDHDASDDPIVLYHELDEARRETRRIELFEDGRLQHSDKVDPGARTSLSLEPLPLLDDIRAQPEFSAAAISAEQFEQVWRRACMTTE